MTAAVRGTSKEALDLSGSTALKSAIAAAGAQGIGRVDPEAARAAMNRPEAPTHGAEGSPAGTPQGANPGFASDVLPPSSAPTAPATPTPPGAVVAFTRFAVSEAIEAGDLLALDSERPGSLRRAAGAADSGVVAIAAAASETIDGLASVPVVDSMFATLRVDAGYGEIRPGNLLCSSPTPGHAMRAAEIVPGTIIGKALEPLESGQGEIRVLLMPR